jgi:predicted RecA/RadA family phage recombinase
MLSARLDRSLLDHRGGALNSGRECRWKRLSTTFAARGLRLLGASAARHRAGGDAAAVAALHDRRAGRRRRPVSRPHDGTAIACAPGCDQPAARSTTSPAGAIATTATNGIFILYTTHAPVFAQSEAAFGHRGRNFFAKRSPLLLSTDGVQVTQLLAMARCRFAAGRQAKSVLDGAAATCRLLSSRCRYRLPFASLRPIYGGRPALETG